MALSLLACLVMPLSVVDSGIEGILARSGITPFDLTFCCCRCSYRYPGTDCCDEMNRLKSLKTPEMPRVTERNSAVTGRPFTVTGAPVYDESAKNA